MHGKRDTHVEQILAAIEYGTLPTDETERRLRELIDREADRNDGPADMAMVSACLDLLEELHRSPRCERPRRGRKLLMAVGAAAAALLLLVCPLRLMLLKQYSTPTEQQYVLTGRQVTTDMVKSALAEHPMDESIRVTDYAQLEKTRGFYANTPEQLLDHWRFSNATVSFSYGSIKERVKYTHADQPDSSIDVIAYYYTDQDFVYLTLEQTKAGEIRKVHGHSFYVTDNLSRITVTWYNDFMFLQCVGVNDPDVLIDALLTCIGGTYE